MNPLQHDRIATLAGELRLTALLQFSPVWRLGSIGDQPLS